MRIHQCHALDNFQSRYLKLTWKVINHWKRQPYFFLANLFLKQGISSEYVTVGFICKGSLGLQGEKKRELQNEKFLPIAGLELTTPDSQV